MFNTGFQLGGFLTSNHTDPLHLSTQLLIQGLVSTRLTVFQRKKEDVITSLNINIVCQIGVNVNMIYPRNPNEEIELGLTQVIFDAGSVLFIYFCTNRCERFQRNQRGFTGRNDFANK